MPGLERRVRRLQSPGNANEEVTLLRRPTARASSSTERMCSALGLCIHMVPVERNTYRVSHGLCTAYLPNKPGYFAVC